MCIFCTQISFRRKSVSFQLTGMPFDNSLKVFIISVDNSHTTLPEQHRFASEIIIKILMLIRSDMVWLDICKNAEIKDKSLCSVKHQSLRRYFHNNSIAACFYHIMKIFLHHVGFRCCVSCRNMLLTDDRLNSSDQANLISCILKNRFHHVCCCCFSLGSCDSDSFQLPGRMSEPCCGNKCHCITCVLYLDHSYISRSFYRFLHDKSFGSFGNHIRYEFMSIYNSTSDTDKKASFIYFTGVINNRSYLLLCASLKTFVFKMFQ